jgi:thymidine kinase
LIRKRLGARNPPPPRPSIEPIDRTLGRLNARPIRRFPAPPNRDFGIPVHAFPTLPDSMAKTYFYYSAMNAGKSTVLLQSSYNYRERGMHTVLFTPALDTRGGPGRIASRIGLSAEATPFTASDDLIGRVRAECSRRPVACVLVDEAQFLTRSQVQQLTDVADLLDIPVLCYGLRTDFQGQLFEGSAALLAWADDLNEIKTICHCGRKATMVLRTDAAGRVLREEPKWKSAATNATSRSADCTSSVARPNPRRQWPGAVDSGRTA